MKNFKLLSILLSTVLLMTITSCDKEDAETGATAEVKVMESGTIKTGVTVHMFSEQTGPSTTFFEPFFAKKTVITESDGIATFILQDIIDLEAIDNQTTLYFAVFNDDEEELGRTAMTIEKGETKSATISY